MARGFSQKEEVDYDEMFAPVARYDETFDFHFHHFIIPHSAHGHITEKRDHLCGSSSQNFYVCSDYRFDFGCWFGSQDLYTFVFSIANLTEFSNRHPFVLTIVLAHKACIHSPCLLPRTHKTCPIFQIP